MNKLRCIRSVYINLCTCRSSSVGSIGGISIDHQKMSVDVQTENSHVKKLKSHGVVWWGRISPAAMNMSLHMFDW